MYTPVLLTELEINLLIEVLLHHEVLYDFTTNQYDLKILVKLINKLIDAIKVIYGK